LHLAYLIPFVAHVGAMAIGDHVLRLPQSGSTCWAAEASEAGRLQH